MSERNLLIIGGAEDKTGNCFLLREFVKLAGSSKSRLAVITTAAAAPRKVGEEYRRLFLKLGASSVDIIAFDKRREVSREAAASLFKATGIFISGGDQLRLTGILGGTVIHSAIKKCYAEGTIVAGTSAGAAVVGATMIVGGDDERAPKKEILRMAPGFALLSDVVIDQHFAQRGRLGRLLAVVAQNPAVFGIGIDENTAALFKDENSFYVLGSETVSVIDGQGISFSNVSDQRENEALSLFDVQLHILSAGAAFNLKLRRPTLSKLA
ncbi:MAG: cyanophycinase [Dethiobacteria bacterium]|nr:cyanophycinase [Bacillota bacterium]